MHDVVPFCTSDADADGAGVDAADGSGADVADDAPDAGTDAAAAAELFSVTFSADHTDRNKKCLRL